MKLVGIKRALLLLALAGVNAVLAAAFFLVVEPMRGEADTKLRSVRNEISGLQAKIQNIKQDLIVFNETLPRYEALKNNGFYLPQDRFMIERHLNELREKSGLTGFSFNIAALQNVENNEATAANLKLIMSRIQVDNVTGNVDMDLYDFISRMNKDFPAHVRMQSFEVRRGVALNSSALQRLAKGEDVNLINGKAVFDWLTVVPITQESPPAGGAIP